MENFDEYFQTYILTGKYQWLVKPLGKLNVHINRIADFGCNDGKETLALMWLLEADEAIGIDKDNKNISNAKSELEHIQTIMWKDESEGIISNNAPRILKNSAIKDVVKFYDRDITQPTPLESNYFDLAFCNFTLYHIWLNQGGRDRVREAINQMSRIIRLGGVVAIREPTKLTDEQALIDFKPLFKSAQLKLKHIQIEELEQGQQITQYLCLKESG